VQNLTIPAYKRQDGQLIEDIEGLEEDIRCWERDIADINRDIPRMEIERLTKQRDAAIAKLKIIELRDKLTKIEGAQ